MGSGDLGRMDGARVSRLAIAENIAHPTCVAGRPPEIEFTREGAPLYPAGKVLRRARISRQQLYQYTALGLIAGVRFNKNGYRLYPESVFRHLALIKRLNQLGYTLADIKELFSERLAAAR